MRILICGSTYLEALNGQAIFTRNLAEGLARRGNQVAVVLPSEHLLPKKSNDQPYTVVALPAIGLGLVHKDLSMAVGFEGQVRSFFDQFHPEIVHVQDPSSICQVVMKEARKRNIPVMATHHVGEEVCAPYFSSTHPLIKKSAEWIVWRVFLKHLGRADLVTVPSRSSVNRLSANGVKRPVWRVPCAVRLDEFYPNPALDRNAIRAQYGLSATDQIVLYVGRVDYEKRVDVLVRALSYLKDSRVKLVIAGEGRQEPHIRLLGNQLGIAKQIHFLGKVEHTRLPDLLNTSDLFCMPGDGESFSIATLEALACGKPVLAARSSALPELVTHKSTGYLFEPGDAQDAARGILYLLGQRAHWGEMARAGVAKAQTFQMNGVMRTYEEAYQSAIRISEKDTYRRSHQNTGLHFPLPQESWFRSWQHTLVLLMITIFIVSASLIFTSDSSRAAPEVRLQDYNSDELFKDVREFILTPHPDDETLEVTGTIHGEIENDGDVRLDIIIRGEDPASEPILTRSYVLSDRQRREKPSEPQSVTVNGFTQPQHHLIR